MESLERQSERYAKTGSISAEGVGRLLGAPHLDPIQLVVRETVQNSWDARMEGVCPKYCLHLRTLTSVQKSRLQATVFADLATQGEGVRLLEGSLRKSTLRVLEVSDFGTTGLGGPTQPDEPPASDEAPDFVDFVRNVGSPRDTPRGGGTYGYGKASLFRLSRCRAILVYTSAKYWSTPVSRLIAAHIGPAFDVRDRASSEHGRYTGRHWWGRKAVEDRLEPVDGTAADDLAEALGLQRRGPESTGTSILVIDPDLDVEVDADEPGVRSVADRLKAALLWNFWPKMIAQPGTGDPAMNFQLLSEGIEITLPEPSQCPPLDLFAASLQLVWRGDPSQITEVRCQKPRKTLGRFALSMDHSNRAERPKCFRGVTSEVPEPCRHVALMRPAELVVKYLSGPPHPSDSVEWGGVFRVDDDHEVEQAFASSEPPAHDSWDPSHLPARSKAKRFVNVGLRELRRTVSNLWRTDVATSPDGDDGGQSFGAVGDDLGSLLLDAEGQALGGPTGGGRRRSTSRPRRRLGRPVFSRLTLVEGRVVGVFESHYGGTDESFVAVAKPIVVGDGVRSDVAPSGARPRVRAWRLSERNLGEGSRVRIDRKRAGLIEIEVEFPDDAALELELREETTGI